LKLLALEGPLDFTFLKLWVIQVLSRLKVLTIEVSAKGGGWGGG
jgi:hypothetical protein